MQFASDDAGAVAAVDQFGGDLLGLPWPDGPLVVEALDAFVILILAGVVTVAWLPGRGPGFHGSMAGGRRDRARALLCGKIA